MDFPKIRKNLAPHHLAVVLAGFLFFVLRVQQVSYIAELFRGALKRLDLLSQLRLLGLFLAEHLVDISHGNCLLPAIYVPIGTSSTNGTRIELRA
jgi:hypothetical protein